MKENTRLILENMNATIDVLKKGLEMGKDTLTSTPYIVTVGGLSVDPVIEDRKTTGKFKFALPCSSQRFTKRDADIIAQVTVNGNGVRGLAVPWMKATKELLEQLIKNVEMVKEYDSE